MTTCRPDDTIVLVGEEVVCVPPGSEAKVTATYPPQFDIWAISILLVVCGIAIVLLFRGRYE